MIIIFNYNSTALSNDNTQLQHSDFEFSRNSSLEIDSSIKIDQSNFRNSESLFDIAEDKDGNYILAIRISDQFGLGSGDSHADSFIVKYDSDFEEVLCSYPVIGSDYDSIHGLVVDNDNNIVAAIETSSNDLKVEKGSEINYSGGGQDIYLLKISDNCEFMWGFYWGGNRDDTNTRIDVDDQNNLILTGRTASLNFPLKNALMTSRFGDFDGFVSKFNENGILAWSTYFGGSGFEDLQGIAIDNNENIYITGYTNSMNFPVQNAYQPSLGGLHDSFITKLNSSGALQWSTYLGGNGNEFGFEIIVDGDQNVYVAGSTMSNNFPLLDNIQGRGGNMDGYLTKFDSEGQLMYSTYLGDSQDDALPYLTLDDQGKLYLGGYQNDLADTSANIFVMSIDINGTGILWEKILKGENYDETFGIKWFSSGKIILNAYTESSSFNPAPTEGYHLRYGGKRDALFAILTPENGDIEFLTLTPFIAEPDRDYDNDGISNQDEYDLCKPSLNSICLDPLNPDTDGDGMWDGWEFENDLNPLDPVDALLDSDIDGLSNLQEFIYGSNPKSPDSDSDGMPDWWEYSMGLNPTLDDSSIDSDNDIMSNLYEYQYGFNASNFNDGALDFDNDGASNAREFLSYTDPTVSDTDGDGMPDGFEIEYNLDPLKNDANQDKDGDLIPNLLEYRLGLNPKSKIELYIIIGIITVFTAVFFGFRRRNKLQVNKAINEGWESYKQKKQAMKDGFSDFEEYKDAVSNGFVNKSVLDLVISQSFKSAEEMTNGWNKSAAQLTLFNGDKQEEEFIQMITQTTSPKHLLMVENNTKPLLQLAEGFQEDVKSIITLQGKIQDLFKERKAELFTEVSENDINEFSKRIFVLSSDLDKKMDKLDQSFANKKEWFSPWQPLLTLIQITGDGMPISLDKISEVTNTSKVQAEDLLLALLNENPEIGSFDNQDKMYTKGTDVSKYLEDAMKMSKMLDEEST